MRKTIRIQIKNQKTKSVLTDYSTDFEITTGTTVSEMKTIIKNSINNSFNIVKESLWNNSKELEDSNLLPKTNNLDYYMEIN